jgi:hypothetical protein
MGVLRERRFDTLVMRGTREQAREGAAMSPGDKPPLALNWRGLDTWL